VPTGNEPERVVGREGRELDADVVGQRVEVPE
jgi:hypothetical protein